MYDPVVARFLSCDNFVQEPTNSQNFNRYSYCLNNPLKYTDPDGNFVVTFGAAIGFASFCLSTYLDPSFDNIVKSAAICAITYGIGSACQALASINGLSTSTCELIRAGAHGFSSGLFAAIEGGDFVSQFAAGFPSSYLGGNMILKTTTDKPIGHHVDKLFKSNFGLVDGRITKINLWNNE